MWTYVFDTSFLVALMCEDDTHHALAMQNMLTIWSNNKFLLSEMVFIETITVLTYKHPLHQRVLSHLLKFLDKTWVQQYTFSFHEYLDFFVLLDKRISFQDASILFDGWSMGAEILSFDEEIIKLSWSIDQLFDQ